MLRRLAFLLSLTLVAAWAGGPLPVATPEAALFHLEGTVTVSLDQGASWQPGQPMETVHNGDQVQTGPSSLAVLLLWDKSTLRLAPNTTVQVEDLSESEDGNLLRRFQLASGRIWADVTHGGTFEMETPHGLASVKGTSFEVEDTPQGRRVQVFEGTVDYLQRSSGRHFMVNHDHGLRLSHGHFEWLGKPARLDAFESHSLATRDQLRRAWGPNERRLRFGPAGRVRLAGVRDQVFERHPLFRRPNSRPHLRRPTFRPHPRPAPRPRRRP